jgi:hypothetical protein
MKPTSWILSLAALGGTVLVTSSAVAPAAPVWPPRIIAAVMLDRNGDSRADGVRLTYSARIRHAVDRDRRYPFVVAGYGVRSVSAAGGRSLVIRLAEHTRSDAGARPAIRYRQTGSKPVVAVAGAQAIAQIFRGTRPLRHARTPVSGPATRTADPASSRDDQLHRSHPRVAETGEPVRERTVAALGGRG